MVRHSFVTRSNHNFPGVVDFSWGGISQNRHESDIRFWLIRNSLLRQFQSTLMFFGKVDLQSLGNWKQRMLKKKTSKVLKTNNATAIGVMSWNPAECFNFVTNKTRPAGLQLPLSLIWRQRGKILYLTFRSRFNVYCTKFKLLQLNICSWSPTQVTHVISWNTEI